MSDENSTQEARDEIEKARTQFWSIENCDQVQQAEDRRNAAFKRRGMWLLPFNFVTIWGTLRYCSNVQTIAKKYWPGLLKVKLINLIIVSTFQAVGFTTFYVGGTLAILGINPVQAIRKYREEQRI